MTGDTPSAATPTVGDLRALVSTATSPAVERGVGILLGASPATARAAVDGLVAAGRLADGLALAALLLASRRGTDAAGAIAELADGRPVPEGWSDYELRSAADEAGEDLAAALRGPRRGAPAVEVSGADAPLRAAAAVRAGSGATLLGGAQAAHLRDGLSLRRAVVDHGWIGRLAGAAGWPVVHRPAPGAETLRALLEGPASAPLPEGAQRGLDEVVACGRDHLALLP